MRRDKHYSSYKRWLSYLSLVLLCLLLGACGHQEKLDKAKKALSEAKKTSKGKVEPLPEFKPIDPHHYQAHKLRSPFELPKSSNIKNGPDQSRPKEPLEKFPLDGLRMVGTLSENKTIWAIVKAPNNNVYRVTVGNYLGQNHGKVSEITDNKIFLTEIVPDGRGAWKKYETSIALLQGDKHDE